MLTKIQCSLCLYFCFSIAVAMNSVKNILRVLSSLMKHVSTYISFSEPDFY